KGVFVFPKEKYGEDQLMEIGLEHGAEDVVDDGDAWEVHCTPDTFEALQAAFEAAGLEAERAELSMVPQNTVNVDVETGRKLMKLVDALDDNDDVSNVHANFDLPEALLAEMAG
ncbi:MAG: YebC/PmpR family DNA-binding transcriptional regulator, partial [Desulfovibrio sp.]|nr:YebC/PmpR family DNA-binding transcriptional regulator [Desulfovibrio sp.]